YQFAILSTQTNAVMSLFAPLVSPLAVNLLAILLLFHLLFANLIFCTQHYGNTKDRNKSYSGQALATFYFSMLGYDLSAINTSLGRLLAGIDTLLQSILMALFVGVVTVESIAGVSSEFDANSLAGYTVAAPGGTHVLEWVEHEGATPYAMPPGTTSCIEALEGGYADACCYPSGTMAELLKGDAGEGLDLVPGSFHEQSVVMYAHESYTDTLADINLALMWLWQNGFIETLQEKWMEAPSAERYLCCGSQFGMTI
ncbi:hypothetical protein KIPB_010713, partial [Kipferlia bialata]